MKEYLKKYWIYIFVFITIIGISYNIYNDNRRENLFMNSNVTKGILIEEIHESVRTTHGEFNFYVKKNKIKLKEYSYFSHLKKGDTVLIEYSIADPKVARVKDKYYMKKFSYIKKNKKINN
jgi:hypothetical protein